MEVNEIGAAERLLESQQFMWGENSKEVANTLSKLSQLYYQNQSYDEAENCMLRALQVKARIYGEAHPEMIPLLEALCIQYRQQQRNEEATKLEGWLERVRVAVSKFKPPAPPKPADDCVQRSAAKVIAQLKVDTATTEETATYSAPKTRDPIQQMVARNNQPQSRGGEVSRLILPTGCVFNLRNESIWIGRDVSNDISLQEDDLVEKQHATIKCEGNNKYVIASLAKSSPLFVNGFAVASKSQLSPGDVVRMGGTEIRVE